MIFILKEQAYNGTVTMSVMITGVEAKNFKEAVQKLKQKIKEKPELNCNILEDSDEKFYYSIAGGFPISGILENEPLKMLE